MASTAVGEDADLGQILPVAILVAVITATCAIVEVMASVADGIIDAMPSANEIAARAMLHGQVLTREEFERQADVVRISDFRR